MVLGLPALKKIPSDCCDEHHEMCWYDQCCNKCPEGERCKARIRNTNERCILPVSKHAKPGGFAREDHEWELIPALTWDGDNG